jgi:hypothetical protein
VDPGRHARPGSPHRASHGTDLTFAPGPSAAVPSPLLIRASPRRASEAGRPPGHGAHDGRTTGDGVTVRASAGGWASPSRRW